MNETMQGLLNDLMYLQNDEWHYIHDLEKKVSILEDELLCVEQKADKCDDGQFQNTPPPSPPTPLSVLPSPKKGPRPTQKILNTPP